VTDTKTESGTFADLLCSEKRVKYVLEVFRLNTRAVIRKGCTDIVACSLRGNR
jgi:hypothetical protein